MQYKYFEDHAIDDLHDYVDSTYGQHYANNPDGVQVLDLLKQDDDYAGFLRGNIIKYAARYDKKGTPEKDLMKALHYGVLLLAELRKEQYAERETEREVEDEQDGSVLFGPSDSSDAATMDYVNEKVGGPRQFGLFAELFEEIFRDAPNEGKQTTENYRTYSPITAGDCSLTFTTTPETAKIARWDQILRDDMASRIRPA